jgi:hypothetical protein
MITSDDLGSEPREVELKNVEKKGEVILLHGIGDNEESPRSFSGAISTKTGKIHGGITTADATLSLSGDCVDSF